MRKKAEKTGGKKKGQKLSAVEAAKKAVEVRAKGQNKKPMFDL